MANFPTKPALSQGESPSLYSNNFAKNVKAAPTDGGYEFRRRQFTRVPPRQIETGFIGLPHADFLILENFYKDHLNDTAFSYYDYMHGVTRQVRFDDFKADPQSIGQTRLWNLKIKMSEI